MMMLTLKTIIQEGRCRMSDFMQYFESIYHQANDITELLLIANGEVVKMVFASQKYEKYKAELHAYNEQGLTRILVLIQKSSISFFSNLNMKGFYNENERFSKRFQQYRLHTRIK